MTRVAGTPIFIDTRTVPHRVSRASMGRSTPRSRPARRATRARRPARATTAEDVAIDMSVQEYIEKHDLTRKVEEALNAAVKAKADEPLAFVVRAPIARRDRWRRDGDGGCVRARDGNSARGARAM